MFFIGPPGSGKTLLASQIFTSLLDDPKDRIASPTFELLRIHKLRRIKNKKIPSFFFHADLFRRPTFIFCLKDILPLYRGKNVLVIECNDSNQRFLKKLNKILEEEKVVYFFLKNSVLQLNTPFSQ